MQQLERIAATLLDRRDDSPQRRSHALAWVVKAIGERDCLLGCAVPPNTQQSLGLYKQWFWAHVFGQALVVPGSSATQAAVQPWPGAASKPYYFSCEE